MTLSRRSFLGGATGLVVGGAVPAIAGAADGLKTLRLASRQVEIGGERRRAMASAMPRVLSA